MPRMRAAVQAHGAIRQGISRAPRRHRAMLDEPNVPDLPAVAVEGYRLAGESAKQKMRDPALILGAALMGAIDAAHAEDECLETEASGVIHHVLVGRTLGAPVRAVEIERP